MLDVAAVRMPGLVAAVELRMRDAVATKPAVEHVAVAADPVVDWSMSGSAVALGCSSP